VVALVVVGSIARVSIGVSVDVSQCSAFNVQCLVVRNGEWNGFECLNLSCCLESTRSWQNPGVGTRI
jgi:hypothetical protein